jgi:hypothetical protein
MNIRSWHLADLLPLVRHVRCRRMNGPSQDAAQGLSLTLSRQFARRAKLWSGCISRPSGRYASPGAAMVINAGEAILASAA